MKRIPKKENAKFKELITGQLVVELENFFLRTKLNQLEKQIERVDISVEEGVDSIYKTCVELIKNNDISSNDIDALFGKQEKLVKKEKQIEKRTKVEKADDSMATNTTDINQIIKKLKEETDLNRSVLVGKSNKNVIDEDFESRIKKYKEERRLVDVPKAKKEEKSEILTNVDKLKEKVDTNDKKSVFTEKRLLMEKRREASIKRRNEEKQAEKEKLNNKSKDSSLGSFLKSFLGAM